MALTNVMILKYNNYYNRIRKKFDDIGEYMSLPFSYVTSINFYKRDGVDTVLTINDTSLTHGISGSLAVEDADYLIEYDTEGILSRWFILEAMQLRNSQYQLTLKRDVIADNWDSVMDATSYIEKATINSNDIAIYNAEDMSFNQIKKEERLLKDETQNAWIIGFYSSKNTEHQVNVGTNEVNAIRVATIESWDFYPFRTQSYKLVTKEVDRIKISGRDLSASQFAQYQNRTITIGDGISPKTYTATPLYGTVLNYINGDINLFANFVNNKASQIRSIIHEGDTNYKYLDEITALDGKYIYASVGSDQFPIGYYQIKVTRQGSSTASVTVPYASNTNVRVNNLLQEFRSGQGSSPNDGTQGNVIYDLEYTSYLVEFQPSGFKGSGFTLKASTNSLSDSPYKMFAIPYDYAIFMKEGSTVARNARKPFATNVASAISEALGSELYDVQLLPFCPWREIITDGGNIDLTGLVEEEDYDLIKDESQNNVGAILYPKYSTFSFDINITYTLPDDAVELKVIGQCDMYRLCSPNYAAAFDFNLLKTGDIKKFNIDCTYKPFTPYIHINPVWGKLYGKDFDDARGLIVQGDFSLPYTNEKWVDYQLNNKNYLNSFNRSIDSIEVANAIVSTNEKVGAIRGGIASAKSGMEEGGKMGGVFGSAIGLSIGTMMGAGTGLYDVTMGEKLRADAISAKADQFDYSLQNIQASPNTLAKVSAFDANNKLFPILEYYTCTDEEKEIFRNKMKYDGMKVMRIDRIRNFAQPEESFIKAQIIRIDIDGDTHMANAISAEINGGIYING